MSLQSGQPVSANAPQSLTDDWVWNVTNTVGQIDGGCCDQQVVVVEGKIGRQTDSNWMVYDFSDNTGTTQADLENKLSFSLVPPNRTLLLNGQGDDFFFFGGYYKINADLMLFADNIK